MPIGRLKCTRNGYAICSRIDPDLTREKLDRTRHLMDKALPDALVTDYEHLIDTIELPDRDDRQSLQRQFSAAQTSSSHTTWLTSPTALSPDSTLRRKVLTTSFWL